MTRHNLSGDRASAADAAYNGRRDEDGSLDVVENPSFTKTQGKQYVWPSDTLGHVSSTELIGGADHQGFVAELYGS